MGLHSSLSTNADGKRVRGISGCSEGEAGDIEKRWASSTFDDFNQVDHSNGQYGPPEGCGHNLCNKESNLPHCVSLAISC